MKRSLKNIIMIVLVILMCGSVVFTMNYAKNNTTNKMPSMNGGGTPPDLPSDNAPGDMKTSDGNDSDEDRKEPPTDNGERLDNNSDMLKPPAKPDGDDNNAPSGMPGNNENNSKTGNVGEMDNNNDFMMNDSVSISSIYYIIFAIEGLVIFNIIMYLIMSNFNKKTFKETFSNKDKVMINILSIIILTSGFTYLCANITNKLLSNTNNNINQNGGQNNSSITYSSQNEITDNTEINEGNFSSTDKDENTIMINGDVDVNISNVTVNKTGNSDGGDNTSFYGINSAILAKSGANVTLKNITVTTDATGANGVFSYGGSATTNNSNSDGTTVIISDSKIITKQDNSGGIMTTGGGIMNAYNLDIETSGTSSAAIRTDRGGGTVTVDGGTYKTTGQGSPTIYSTANITVSNAMLTSEASEGIVIEGKNSVTINNSTLIDTNNKLNGQSTTYKNIFLYQSMSGDAANGNSIFNATNSKITTNNGDTFYITNTSSTINLTNNEIINNDSTGNFLRAQADSWGTNGSNGGDVTLNMTNQKALGNIVVDKISTLVLNMKEGSYFEGTINGDNSAKSIKLNLDSTSKIKLTGDSYVTEFTNSDSTNSNIDFNGYKLYVNGTAVN